MKLFIAFLAFILTVTAISDQELWAQFKKEHNKTYKSIVEEKLRYGIFQKNLRVIEEHNVKFKKGEKSYKMGINRFTDLTSEEFVELQTLKIPNLKFTNVFKSDPNFQAPTSVDWRTEGAVLEVKDQGKCGGCWAFSATGALEGQNFIKNNKTISLSEQELKDCSSDYGNQGCDGGVMEYAFEYVKDNGIATESAYPYKALDEICKSGIARADISISGYTEVESSENALRDAVASVGPVSVGMNSIGIRHYESGIFDESSCLTRVNHGVLAVGYGTEGNTDFWIIKNSWGQNWGENGFFRLARNKNQQCAIGSWNTYPNVN